MNKNNLIETRTTKELSEQKSSALPTQKSRTDAYIHQATAQNTRRAYQSAIRQFERHGGLLPSTPEGIADYLTRRAVKLNPRTLSLHLTALSHWHQYQHLSDPTQSPQIRKLLTGIYRQHGQPKRKAKALQPNQIRQMVQYCLQKNTLRNLRDNALIQTAYFGAFRRSEVVALQVGHLTFDHDGLVIMVPHSKTDQTHEGKVKALPYGNIPICPVTALKCWLDHAKIESGPVFRQVNRWDQVSDNPLHPDSVNTLLKTLAKACGLEHIECLSSHSLRRGFATSAAHVGADFESIKRQGHWKNDQTVREYIEEGQLFDRNAAQYLLKTAFNQEKG